MDHVFNIGDTVKVTSMGKFYTTYTKVADLMHLTNWLHGRGLELGKENLEGETAEVVAIHNHPLDAYITLLGIRMHSTNHEYIISSNGVELIQVSNMKYNGMKVETITEGHWPDGVELICSDDGVDWHKRWVVCLHNGVGFLTNGEASLQWAYWAILPPKLPPRMLTNREVLALCRKGWDVCVCGTVSSTPEYSIHDDGKDAEDTKLRAPGSDEWVEPTSDLLEV